MVCHDKEDYAMKSGLRSALVLAAMLLLSHALATLEITCDVEEDRLGARTVTRSVQFATGSELNRAIGTFEYDTFTPYALLWFGEGQVAILEHDGFTVGIGTTFDLDSLEALYRIQSSRDFVQVNGTIGQEYAISCKRFGRWIDDRL